MGTRLARSSSWFRRSVAIAAGLATAGGLAVFASGAAAAPQPSVGQVQARINQLTTQFDKVSEQFDQASQQLSAAQSRLSQVRLRLGHAHEQFAAAQADMAQMAAAAFEDTGATSIAAMLTSGDTSGTLQRGSLLLEMSGSRRAETRQLLIDASQLTAAEQQMQRTEDGIAALKAQLADHKRSLGSLIATQKATLASLTVPQQQAVQSNSIGGNGTSASQQAPQQTPQQYAGPVSSQAGKAVAFAYAQLGCPYVYGGTGPCQMGFDCSGLAQAAWAAAGVQIPRTTYDDWASLPHVSLSALEPGDLILFDGEGHVGIYVGGNELIDAPVPGANVEKVPLSGWYAQTADGAVRP
ncbi:MAG: C40 family peptidase [Actinobacteria bacterium]|nr:C40 family peptidase [Actinomycetota bacterium]